MNACFNESTNTFTGTPKRSEHLRHFMGFPFAISKKVPPIFSTLPAETLQWGCTDNTVFKEPTFLFKSVLSRQLPKKEEVKFT